MALPAPVALVASAAWPLHQLQTLAQVGAIPCPSGLSAISRSAFPLCTVSCGAHVSDTYSGTSCRISVSIRTITDLRPGQYSCGSSIHCTGHHIHNLVSHVVHPPTWLSPSAAPSMFNGFKPTGTASSTVFGGVGEKVTLAYGTASIPAAGSSEEGSGAQADAGAQATPVEPVFGSSAEVVAAPAEPCVNGEEGERTVYSGQLPIILILCSLGTRAAICPCILSINASLPACMHAPPFLCFVASVQMPWQSLLP